MSITITLQPSRDRTDHKAPVVDISLQISIVILMMAAALIMLLAIASRDRHGPGYERKLALFTPAEKSLLASLEKVLERKYRVFGKVRVADVLSVRKSSDRRAWRRAFNRISSKHVDFVLCDQKTLMIVAAVELDDRSHGQR